MGNDKSILPGREVGGEMACDLGCSCQMCLRRIKSGRKADSLSIGSKCEWEKFRIAICRIAEAEPGKQHVPRQEPGNERTNVISMLKNAKIENK